MISTYPLNFGGGINTLENGEGADLRAGNLPAKNPPAGRYCLAVLFEELSPSRCTSADGYCTVDYVQFDGVQEFK